MVDLAIHGPVAPGMVVETRNLQNRLLRYVAVLPDPREQAYHLTERLLTALRTAWKGAEGWRVDETFRRECLRDGLADRQGYLTVFGMAVRREVLRDDA